MPAPIRPQTLLLLSLLAMAPASRAKPSARTVQTRASVYIRPAPGCDENCDRYVLYSDSTFALVSPAKTLGGVFTRRDSVLTLRFSNQDPRWTATGTIRADSLWIVYGEFMSLSDFAGGLFLRRGAQ